MPLTSSYRRYRRRARKTRTMGGIRKGFRGRRRVMTTGKVKRIIGAELKFLVQRNHDVVINAGAPFVQPLTYIAQGNNNNQRDGNRLSPTNIHGNLTVIGEDAAAGTIQANIRCLILRWNEDASVAEPTVNDIIQANNSIGGAYNIDNRGQFKVVWSRYFVLINNADNPQFKKTLRFYVRLSGAPKILYDGAGGVAANAKKYHYYFMVMSDSLDSPELTLDSTFRFTDS